MIKGFIQNYYKKYNKTLYLNIANCAEPFFLIKESFRIMFSIAQPGILPFDITKSRYNEMHSVIEIV